MAGSATLYRGIRLKHLSAVCKQHSRNVSTRVLQHSAANVQALDDEVEYPPIKPKYPPGNWGELSPRQAWTIDEEAQTLLSERTAKWRLEKLAGPADQQPLSYNVRLVDHVPKTLAVKQHLTRTHIVDSLPEIYKNIDVGATLDKLKPRLISDIEHQADQFNFELEKDETAWHSFSHGLFRRWLTSAFSFKAATTPHLLRSQFDENVRVETFWKRGGYRNEDAKKIRGVKMGSILNLSLKYNASFKIRTELPLPEILPYDDPICQHGSVPEYWYSPSTALQCRSWGRPISVSGHWVGDPCEFGHTTVIVPEPDAYNYLMKEYGDSIIEEASLSWGLTAGFGSCVSQAYNQGFFPWVDVTYPFVDQVVVTNGEWVRFFVYQLNTIHLWKDNAAQPARNVLWASPRMDLYESLKGGRVHGLSEKALRHLIQALLLQPADRGVDLRPYLPEEPAPRLQNRYINIKDVEPPIPQYKPGRWEYPRISVYF